jgi:hypothetical protein
VLGERSGDLDGRAQLHGAVKIGPIRCWPSRV